MFSSSKNFFFKFSIYKFSKLIVITNFWKNYVYLFANSELVTGQSPSTFITLFLRTCLCFLNSLHSHSKWSAVCGLFLQKHVGPSCRCIFNIVFCHTFLYLIISDKKFKNKRVFSYWQHASVRILIFFSKSNKRYQFPYTYLLTYLLHGAECFLRS
jgi:hypothetical protein